MFTSHIFDIYVKTGFDIRKPNQIKTVQVLLSQVRVDLRVMAMKSTPFFPDLQN